MKNDRPKKNIVEDVRPPKRSIRDVDLPASRMKRKTVSDIRDEAPADKFTRSVPLSKNSVSRLPRPEFEKIVVPSTPPPPSISSVPPIPPPPPSSGPWSQVPPPKSPIPPPRQTYAYEYDEPVKSSRKGLYTALVIFVLAAAFGVSALFKGATITVTPKHVAAPVSETFTAKKDQTGVDLGFQVVTVSKELRQSLPATGQSKVETKATGKIIIYNNSVQSQPLVATTRFQTPEGLVFRLNKAVTVPASTKSGSKVIPGSVEAIVTADIAGPTYNIGLKDFTLPGLKGSAKYTQIFARSKTSMTGGFSGVRKTISGSDVAAAESAMEVSLKEGLARDISTQIPADFVLYKESLVYSFEPASQISSTSTDAVVEKRGTITAVIFDKGALTRAITAKVLPASGDQMVKITNLDTLVFAYTDDLSNPANVQTLSFKLEGNANIVWIFDADKLKADLLGLSKVNAEEFIAVSYPSIGEAWIETRPFWNKTIPLDPKKVTLVNTLEK